MIKMTRRSQTLALGFALAAMAIAMLVEMPGSAENDQGVLAQLLSRILSTPATRVSIGQVEGALSSDALVRDIVISDRDGVWLRLDRARLIWTRTALFLGRLEIDRLEIGKLDLLRKPLPSPDAPPSENEPLLPELPVKVEVKSFTLGELDLGAPILGTPARIKASGSVKLGNPSEGLDLRFAANRLDAAGELNAALSYVPQSAALDAKLALKEPAGGLLARVAGLPDLPPVSLDLNGTGTLDSFGAQLGFVAGPRVGANGTVRLRREGTVRHLGLNLAAQVEGLMPPIVAGVFSGITNLHGDVTFEPDGGVRIASIELTSQTARLETSGRLGADMTLDLSATAAALPGATGTTVFGETEIGKFKFEGKVTGPIRAPRMEATIALANARFPWGRIAALDGSVSATPNGPVADPASRTALLADVLATGVALSDPAMARAVGDRFSLTLRGAAAGNGAGDFQSIRISTPTIEALYSGRLGARDISGTIEVSAPDLARFGDIADLRLAGAATLSADLEGSPLDRRYVARVDAKASRLSTGIGLVDGLAGGMLTLTGTARALPDGGFGFTNMQLEGAHASAHIDGDATTERADLNAHISIPNLKNADDRLSGQGDVTAHLTGTLLHPDATMRVAASGMKALARPVPSLVLEIVAHDLSGAADASAKLKGDVDGKLAVGTLHLAKEDKGGWNIDKIDLAVGSVTLQGGIMVDSAGLATGRLTLAAQNLDDLSPLALSKFSGRVNADLSLYGTAGHQDIDATARGSGIRLAGIALENLDGTVRIADMTGHAVLNAAISVDRASFGNEAIANIRLDSKGTPQGSDVSLSASARGFAMDARGRFVPGDNARFDLTAFSARNGDRRIMLAGPASIVVLRDGAHIQNLTLAIDGGRLNVDGTVGPRLNLRAFARALPLSLGDLMSPGLGLSGTLDGDAKIAGTAASLSGDWRARIAGLTAPQARSAGLPPVEVAASGRLEGQRTSISATLAAGKAATLRIDGWAPLASGAAVDLSARGHIDAGIANNSLSIEGRQLAGGVTIDMRVAGALSDPQVSGTAALAGGSFTDYLQGVRLNNIGMRIVARGKEITVETASATTPNGGSLSANGRVAVDPAAGFPGAVHITARNAELVSNSLATANANLSLDLSGPLARDPRISGRVDLTSMEVSIPERLPTTLRPLDGIRHIKPPPIVVARLADQRRARGSRTGKGLSAPFNATLDIAISAPNQVFVRGRGLDAELGGEVKLTGTLVQPVAVGAFDLRRGRLTALATRLDFTRGRLSFTGDLTPSLDFIAQTQAADVTAQIAISGPASEPVFSFSSTPQLPQDEVLSRVLFSKASGSLSPFQALQLAQAAAQFSGSGDNSFERLRRSLGVQNLDIVVGGAHGPTVGLSRALSNDISLGVKAGATAAQTGVTVNLDVTRHLRLQGEVDSNGGTALGVGTEWDY